MIIRRGNSLPLWAWVALVWIAGLALLPAQPAGTLIIVELQNGDRLSGVLVSQSTNQLVLSNAWLKEFALPLSAIVKRTPPAPLAPAAPAVTQAPAAPPPAITPTNVVGILRPAPATPVPAPAPVAPKPPQRWHADFQAGVDLTFSEKNRQTYHARAKITYAKERFRNLIDYAALYGTAEGDVVANRMEGSNKTDFDLGRKIYVYNRLGAGYDQIRRIDFRYEVGPGFGYHVLKLTNFVADAELGATYQEEQRSNGHDVDNFYLRLAEIVAWKISTRFSFDQKFEFFPRIEDPSEYRFRFESTVRYWLRQNLSLNLSVVDYYDTDPARQVTRNDLQILSSVGLKF